MLKRAPVCYLRGYKKGIVRTFLLCRAKILYIRVFYGLFQFNGNIHYGGMRPFTKEPLVLSLSFYGEPAFVNNSAQCESEFPYLKRFSEVFLSEVM